MNQAEWRRKKLLEHTRNLYNENRILPAVHPRYKMLHRHMYEEEYDKETGSFGLRIVICIIMFILYITMEYSDTSVLGVNSMQVLEKIMQNFM